MARRFQFRLEVVRRLRESQRDGQRRLLADRAAAVRDAQSRITGLHGRVEEDVRASRAAQRTRRLDADTLRVRLLHRGWLHRKIDEAAAVLSDAQAALTDQRTRLVEADRRLKTLEKLRDRQLGRHRTQEARRERAASDETALLLHLRRGRGLRTKDTR